MNPAKALCLASLIAACGPTTHLTVSSQVAPLDMQNLQRSVALINDYMGCELVTISVVSRGQNVEFTSDTGCHAELQSYAPSLVLGLTAQNPFAQDSSTCLSSFAVDGRVVVQGERSGVLSHNTGGTDTLGNIPEDYTQGYALAIYIHELGHMMGLQHTDNEGDIMYASIDAAVDVSGRMPHAMARFAEQLKDAGVVCPAGTALATK